MCFCESDAVNVLIHVKARKLYPGIKYHEASLQQIAKEFQLVSTFQIHAMSESEVANLCAALLSRLPTDAYRREYETAV